MINLLIADLDGVLGYTYVAEYLYIISGLSIDSIPGTIVITPMKIATNIRPPIISSLENKKLINKLVKLSDISLALRGFHLTLQHSRTREP